MYYRNPRRREERKAENLFEEIVAENFPNLGKATNVQLYKTKGTPNKVNPRRSTLRHTIIKMTKGSDKERILKAAREWGCLGGSIC